MFQCWDLMVSKICTCVCNNINNKFFISSIDSHAYSWWSYWLYDVFIVFECVLSYMKYVMYSFVVVSCVFSFKSMLLIPCHVRNLLWNILQLTSGMFFFMYVWDGFSLLILLMACFFLFLCCYILVSRSTGCQSWVDLVPTV